MPSTPPNATPSTSPALRWWGWALDQALEQRASDLHLGLGPEGWSLRARIDGRLVAWEPPPVGLEAACIAQLKLLAGLALDERRRPQDGRFHHASARGVCDVRVASVPALRGEAFVLRLLAAERLPSGLASLAAESPTLRGLGEVLQGRDGIALVCGPTGSGKTTTLYAALRELNREDCKILTVEDPVEYRLDGVMQVAVRPDLGLGFAEALRAFLRHAPNVILVGEVRDTPTAEVAIQAALTGHLVLGTLHSTDSTTSFGRLQELGIEPALLAAAWRCSLAQRLVRRLCPDCGARRSASTREQDLLGCREQPAPQIGTPGCGCPQCSGQGYRGRLALHELCRATPGLRQALACGTPPARLRCLARQAGLRTLREDGWEKVRQGRTSLAEVLAAVPSEALDGGLEPTSFPDIP